MRVPLRTPGIPAVWGTGEEESYKIKQRVAAALAIQKERFREAGIRRNARISPGLIERFCPLTAKAGEALNLAAARLGLSGRACHGIIKISRTIADLDGKDSIDTVHILEAVQHRRFGDDPYDILSAGE
jgi:magnesium chelatase family protein